MHKPTRALLTPSAAIKVGEDGSGQFSKANWQLLYRPKRRLTQFDTCNWERRAFGHSLPHFQRSRVLETCCKCRHFPLLKSQRSVFSILSNIFSSVYWIWIQQRGLNYSRTISPSLFEFVKPGPRKDTLVNVFMHFFSLSSGARFILENKNFAERAWGNPLQTLTAVRTIGVVLVMMKTDAVIQLLLSHGSSQQLPGLAAVVLYLFINSIYPEAYFMVT